MSRAWHFQQLVPYFSGSQMSQWLRVSSFYSLPWFSCLLVSKPPPYCVLSKRFPIFTAQAQLPFVHHRGFSVRVDDWMSQFSVFGSRRPGDGAEQEWLCRQPCCLLPRKIPRQVSRFMSVSTSGLNSL